MDNKQDEQLSGSRMALHAVAGPAFQVHKSPYFTKEDADALLVEANTLWRNGHHLSNVINYLVENNSKISGTAIETNFSELDVVLERIIVSAFSIGAASILHPANIKHYNMNRTIKSRYGKEKKQTEDTHRYRLVRDLFEKMSFQIIEERMKTKKVLDEINTLLKDKGEAVTSASTIGRLLKELRTKGQASHSDMVSVRLLE